MGIKKRSKGALTANLKQVLVGIDKHLTESSVMINGTAFEPSETRRWCGRTSTSRMRSTACTASG